MAAMTQGSGGGPADRDDTEQEPASSEDAGDGGGASGSGAAPDEESETEPEPPQESEAESEAESDAPESVGAGPSGTKLGNAGEVAREAQARKEMDWLMTVSPEASGLRKIVDPDDGKAPIPPPPEFKAVPLGGDEDFFDPEAQTRPDIVPKGIEEAERRRVASASGEFEASPDLDEPGESTAKPIVRVGPSRPLPGRVAGRDARETREDLEVPRGKAKSSKGDEDDGFERVLTTGHAANSRPSEPVPADESSGGGRGVWIAGIVVVGAVAAFLGLRKGEDAPTEVESKPKVAGLEPKAPEDPSKDPPEDPPKEPRDRTTHSDVTPPQPTPVEDDPPPPKKPVEADPVEPVRPVSSDPREPPPGTPDAIAAVFKKIPVSPSDQAPVGGIGATGIHVDRIEMGVSYDNGQCTGEAKTFSLSRGDRPSVCVRLVHQRQPEDVALLWEKKDGAVRRGKLSVKPLHAYRTRAYLVLRREYIGDWTVRVESTDGVELATYDFSVVE